MSEPHTQVVCDAGPLIHLDELNCLDLLHDFNEVLIPDQVWKEVAHHRPAALAESPFTRVTISLSTEPTCKP